MTGRLTTKRYTCATIFVDQYSRLGYVYFQKTDTAEETILAKQSFEAYAKTRGVNIKAYQSDNGIFRANKWVEECMKHQQGLTFAGFNAHHENGICERRIRLLQDLTRTQLIHANRKWPKAITANLWPYAMRMASSILNETPSMQDPEGRTPQ